MSKQPESLRLADALERAVVKTDQEDDVIHVARWFVEQSASELRRLHAINAELVKALKECDEAMSYMSEYDIPLTLPSQVKDALTKAERSC